MKRFFSILTIIATLLCSGCINTSEGSASVEDLYVGGINNRRLMLDGAEGCTTTFYINKANYDWEIIDYKGFTCTPNSGSKVDSSNPVTITATTIKSNNTADTIRLSDLNFKLLSTRFVGISAYQLPQICLPKGNTVYVDAKEGSITTYKFVSKAENISLTTSSDKITATLGEKNARNEYTITVQANLNNNSTNEEHLGSIGFVVDGVAQEGKVEVIQIAAIQFDRSIVLLPSKAGVSNMFTVNSKFSIEVSSNSDKFTIAKIRDNEYSVTANSDNATSEELSLGTIVVSLADTQDCSAEIEVRQRKAVASQTIIAKFVGTNLQDEFRTNIKNMLKGLNGNIQGDAVMLAIFTESTTDATLYELRYDTILGKAVQEKVQELSLSTPYNAALFEANLRSALEFAPAEKYALLIGSHGLGWVPKSSSVEVSRSLMRMGISPSTLWERNKDAVMTRHIGDKGSVVEYDVSEIATAIEANNIKFDYILFDACFMSNIETAYELRNATDRIIGSPCEVIGEGFPYAKIMQYMLLEGGTSYNLDKICSEFVNYFKNEAYTPSGCAAVTNTAELEALATAMKAVNEAGIKADFSLKNVQYYEGQRAHSFYDLGDMVEQSCADATAAAAFKEQLDKTVTSRYHTDRFYSGFSTGNSMYHDINYYSGISTSAMVEHYSTDWQQTAWYKATH